jgi:FAD binding domain
MNRGRGGGGLVKMRTQVAIIGGGPSGLLVDSSCNHGITNVILERRRRHAPEVRGIALFRTGPEVRSPSFRRLVHGRQPGNGNTRGIRTPHAQHPVRMVQAVRGEIGIQ